MKEYTRNKVYFISDLHLGANYVVDARAHQDRFINWLDTIKHDAHSVYLLGDIFDFWFEYKRVIPRGHTRVLAKLCELVDAGIPVHFFVGNHDMWLNGYLEHEVGLKVYMQPELLELDGTRFYLAHGDGLGDTDRSFLLLRKVFRNRFIQKLFAFFVHPNLAVRLGQWWSGKSRKSHAYENGYRGEDNEHLVTFAKSYLTKEDPAPDFFIFGHRHIVLDLQIASSSRVIILGDGISGLSYGVFSLDDKCFELCCVE